MKKIDCDCLYFDPADVLDCGQVFRYERAGDGFKVFSRDKACYVYKSGAKTIIECDDPDYFYNYFDLSRDYGEIIKRLKEFNQPTLNCALERAKGLRLLNQDAEETIISFILSQNNNIPRIKGIISRICGGLGEQKEFMGEKFFTFPAPEILCSKPPEYYRSLGAGYRDEYVVKTAKKLADEGVAHLYSLPADELKKRLLTYCGVGPKVADCICLFAFGKAASFPVDTWVEKIYREDFGGQEKSPVKINRYFTELFGEYSGFAQQYLFYFKRANL